eukprot:gnl/MRDRNA2_/MRDRNA2_113554_c0_seq1.p1 gnl/MRDRNA2_/MRDRNA2_113554_c0~~gnl/MRDRNA2_/MRDRNA2_113554_c0_seq1.p1  ORF type:complete len:152 (-),score=17.88 gnl/MRDRNA2_/MRDRNA2_113554_c0_seq1:142-597(-)
MSFGPAPKNRSPRLQQTDLCPMSDDARGARTKVPPVPKTVRPQRRGNSSHGAMYKEMLRNGKNNGLDIFGAELPSKPNGETFYRSYCLEREQTVAGKDPLEWGPQAPRGLSVSAAVDGPRRRELDRRQLSEQSRLATFDRVFGELPGTLET